MVTFGFYSQICHSKFLMYFDDHNLVILTPLFYSNPHFTFD